MTWAVVAGALGLFVVHFVVQVRRAGPAHLDEAQLARATVLHRWTREEPGEGWQRVGSRTTVDGLNIRFDHDDDPQAEASLIVPGVDRSAGVARRVAVRLGADFRDYHAHTAGYAFRVRMRGTGPVVGKEVCLIMKRGPGGKPFCGRIENDDDTDAAVGGWIEVEWAEILEVV